MSDFNNVVLLGRLVESPELKYGPDGEPICSFTVATWHTYTKSDGEPKQAVTNVEVEVCRRLAELCAQFLKKGRQVLVTGRLEQERWTEPKTKRPRSKLKVVAVEVKFLGRNGSVKEVTLG